MNRNQLSYELDCLSKSRRDKGYEKESKLLKIKCALFIRILKLMLYKQVKEMCRD